MGDGADNIEHCHHKLRGSNSTEHYLTRHYGAISVNTKSGNCTTALWRAFRDAALTGTVAEMDDAGEAAWGTWYTDNITSPTGCRGTLKAAIEATCG